MVAFVRVQSTLLKDSPVYVLAHVASVSELWGWNQACTLQPDHGLALQRCRAAALQSGPNTHIEAGALPAAQQGPAGWPERAPR